MKKKIKQVMKDGGVLELYDGELVCDECGSRNLTKAGHNSWRIVEKNPSMRVKVQRYQCKDCGKFVFPKVKKES
jgi:DNA-directed RNA polymerase subunit RPC12/RpoP